MGLEGLVSKHRERVYRPGRCDHWIKVKNHTTKTQNCHRQRPCFATHYVALPSTTSASNN